MTYAEERAADRMARAGVLVLAALRERMRCGIGPTFAKDAIHAIRVVDTPGWLGFDDGPGVLAYLEERGLVYKVSADHSTILPKYRPEPFAWVPTGSTHKGQTLPPYTPTEAP